MSKQEASERVTIMIDSEVQTKVRKVQALLITETNCNWSFSTVLNALVLIGIKKTPVSQLAEKIIKWEKVD